MNKYLIDYLFYSGAAYKIQYLRPQKFLVKTFRAFLFHEGTMMWLLNRNSARSYTL